MNEIIVYNVHEEISEEKKSIIIKDLNNFNAEFKLMLIKKMNIIPERFKKSNMTLTILEALANIDPISNIKFYGTFVGVELSSGFMDYVNTYDPSKYFGGDMREQIRKGVKRALKDYFKKVERVS